MEYFEEDLPATEVWSRIPFGNGYYVSNRGQVRSETAMLQIGSVNDGSLSVVLTSEKTSRPYLVRRLVAEAFCAKLGPNCGTVVHLDGDKTHCDANNLVWRPRWYAWQYCHQFNTPIRSDWMRPVFNIRLDEEFNSVIQAGMYYGILWKEVYRSAIEHVSIFPHGFEFAFL
jgi:hypothetical protein